MAEKKDEIRNAGSEESSSATGKAGTIRQRHEQFQSEAERGAPLNPGWKGQGTTQDAAKHTGQLHGGTNPGTRSDLSHFGSEEEPGRATSNDSMHRRRNLHGLEGEQYAGEENWQDLDPDTYQDAMDEGLDSDEDGGMRRDENRGLGIGI